MPHDRQYSLIARTYAQALFSGAGKQGVLQRVTEEAKSLALILAQSPRLLIFLSNPRVSTENKSQLIDTVLRSRLSPIMLKLLLLTVKRDRTGEIPAVLARFQELVEQAEGIHQATLESAIELGFQDKLRLKNALEKYTGSRLRIDYLVNPGLLGGLVFRYKDLLMDGSISHGLENLRRQMLGAQL